MNEPIRLNPWHNTSPWEAEFVKDGDLIIVIPQEANKNPAIGRVFLHQKMVMFTSGVVKRWLTTNFWCLVSDIKQTIPEFDTSILSPEDACDNFIEEPKDKEQQEQFLNEQVKAIEYYRSCAESEKTLPYWYTKIGRK